MTQPRFVPPALPERFILEVPDGEGAWIDEGLWRADQFVPLDGTPGAVYAQQPSGRPQILRCIRQYGDLIDVLDGSGEQYTYRIVPFPAGGYTESS